MAWIVIIAYCLSLFAIFLFALLQFNLGINYIRAKKTRTEVREKQVEKKQEILDVPPMVTIQLPLYNEKYVVERLIDSVSKMNYPKDRFEVQVLDDSTDETTEIAQEVVDKYVAQGFDFKLIRREKRIGFKAGALDYGLRTAKGDFVAIFDADFVINPDFLNETLSRFIDPKIGLVQTRWEHLNRDHSLLTKLQAFGLDGHFSVEQVGRNFGSHFINFNGTAGIWRKETIIDAGGWEHDTLTEDLDLSYRAQMKDWKFVYLEEVDAPAELPMAISALKNQQFRWTKGGAENFIKMSPKLVFKRGIPFRHRLHGLGHLFNSSVYFFVFTAAIMSVPLLTVVQMDNFYSDLIRLTSVFFVSTAFLMFYYALSFREKHRNAWVKGLVFILRFFQFLAVSLGMSFYNTKAVVMAYVGKKTPFVRTPKFNIGQKGEGWKSNAYLLNNLKFSTIIEGLLCLYFLFGIIQGVYLGLYGMIAFHALLSIGFGAVFISTISERKL